MTFAVLIFGFAYGVLALKNFRLASQLFVCLLPTYLVRIRLGPLPSTALEVAFGFLTLAWLIRYARTDLQKIVLFAVKHRLFSYSVALFFTASVISIFTSDMWWYSFGQWRAYFLEPLILFMIFIGRSDNLSHRDLLRALGWASAPIALYAIFQGFSGAGLDNSGRAVSFFTSPNAVGLYLAPLIVLLSKQIYDRRDKFQNNFVRLFRLPETWLLFFSLTAVIFSRSLGTIAGLATALLFALIIFKKKNIASFFLVALLAGSILMFRLNPAPQQKFQSLQNRVTLWTYSFEYLTASPKNYLFGTGLRQFFRKIQKPHYDPKKMERLIYPHNILLNFWTETGFIGLIGFTGIFACLGSFFRYILRRGARPAAAACLGVLVVIFVHGLVDVPYFKNDLAMLFWILSAYIIKVKQAV